MSIYTIGTILKEIRIEKGISQTDMCRGLCSKPMVSYIENEMRIPHRKLIESLFSRLGETAPVEKIPMTNSDFLRHNLEHRINSCVAIGNYDIKNMLDEYVSCKKSMTHLEKQFLEFYSTLYENKNYDKNEETINKLSDVLKMTISDYELKTFPKRLLTTTEIFILNNIARCKYDLGETAEAISMMMKLKEYLEKDIIEEDIFASGQPMILFNLANWIGLGGDYEQALKLSISGLELCIKYGKLSYFTHHIFNKGYSLAKLNYKQKALEVLDFALKTYSALNWKEIIRHAVPILNKEFGFAFDTEKLQTRKKI